MADFTDVVDIDVVVDVNSDLTPEQHALINFEITPGTGGGDQLKPTFVFAPVATSTLAPADQVVIEITDNDALLLPAAPWRLLVVAEYPTLNRTEVVYDGDSFLGDYTGSVVETQAPSPQIIEVTVSRTGGWVSHPMTLRVSARDLTGNYAEGIAAYTVDPDPTPPAVDLIAPQVQNFAPTPGSAIDPLDAVEFDITDDTGVFARNMIVVAFDDGTQELVYDGLVFTARYLAGSTIAPTTIGQDAGFHFTLRRTGGWIGATITVRAFAVDGGGNIEA